MLLVLVYENINLFISGMVRNTEPGPDICEWISGGFQKRRKI